MVDSLQTISGKDSVTAALSSARIEVQLCAEPYKEPGPEKNWFERIEAVTLRGQSMGLSYGQLIAGERDNFGGIQFDR